MSKYLVSVFSLLLMAPLYADQQTPQTLRVIPKTYISPGASGSIGTSQTIERHNLYGGQRVPDGVRHEQHHFGTQSLESRGTIKQSIEYPGGSRVQQYPGQSSDYYERRR